MFFQKDQQGLEIIFQLIFFSFVQKYSYRKQISIKVGGIAGRSTLKKEPLPCKHPKIFSQL